ncbi:DUF4058 family protein [Oscillatoria sp. CS-180]|uniref:DUF4058 family protein n=1 Tax=Oscillatoria sp. CS-180 TaxID=3021720 RepID=UPI00232B53F5|nr:DUF4058 family protein [Oscillatoria sp. CS-180]MDB9528646.1 DUF4058 family protein [Oscillatoria sp. CS-180]
MRWLIWQLQPLLLRIYKKGRYYLAIDYEQPLAPPLVADDAAWLTDQISTADDRT